MIKYKIEDVDRMIVSKFEDGFYVLLDEKRLYFQSFFEDYAMKNCENWISSMRYLCLNN